MTDGASPSAPIEAPGNLRVAVSLMRMALALLDLANKPWAACHLQQAIDMAEDKRSLSSVDEFTPELIEALRKRTYAQDD